MPAQARLSETLDVAAPLTAKLARSVSLSPREVAVLAELQVPTHQVRSQREIIAEGRRYSELFVLLEGFGISFRVSQTGRRQVFNIFLPGDFIGFPACFFETSPFSVAALGNAQLSSIPMTRLLALFKSKSRLPAILLWQFSYEAAMYAEHLSNLCRRSAVERLAHFLLELLIRLQVIDHAKERSFTMPLTQELMGDLLGLSVSHVSRSLRQLREDRLVSIEGRSVIIEDFEGLAAMADFERSHSSRLRINDALGKPDRG